MRTTGEELSKEIRRSIIWDDRLSRQNTPPAKGLFGWLTLRQKQQHFEVVLIVTINMQHTLACCRIQRRQ